MERQRKRLGLPFFIGKNLVNRYEKDEYLKTQEKKPKIQI
jgi:hypothetical protein